MVLVSVGMADAEKIVMQCAYVAKMTIVSDTYANIRQVY